MEKKRMTKSEAIELLKNRKVYVNGNSAEIQKKLFELGWGWITGDKKIKIEDAPFLYINKLQEHGFSHGNDMLQFIRDSSQEISADEILAIEVVGELKENDVIVAGWSHEADHAVWVSIIKEGDNTEYEPKATLILKSICENEGMLQFGIICNKQDWTRPATEEEKQKLIDALKKESTDNRAKAILKEVFGIEYCPFKPFDKVLVRDNDTLPWVARFFDRMYEGDYGCTDFLCYKHCIPYEGNQYLHNTTNNPEK